MPLTVVFFITCSLSLGRKTNRHKDKTQVQNQNILQNKKIPHSPSVSCYDKLFFEDPQAINSGIIVKCDVDSDVSYSFSGNLVQFTEIEANEFRPTPLLGEHSLDILNESGFQPEKISELINEGVILVN